MICEIPACGSDTEPQSAHCPKHRALFGRDSQLPGSATVVPLITFLVGIPLAKAEAFLRAFAAEGKWSPERAAAQSSPWLVSDALRNHVLPEFDRLRSSLAASQKQVRDLLENHDRTLALAEYCMLIRLTHPRNMVGFDLG